LFKNIGGDRELGLRHSAAYLNIRNVFYQVSVDPITHTSIGTSEKTQGDIIPTHRLDCPQGLVIRENEADAMILLGRGGGAIGLLPLEKEYKVRYLQGPTGWRI